MINHVRWDWFKPAVNNEGIEPNYEYQAIIDTPSESECTEEGQVVATSPFDVYTSEVPQDDATAPLAELTINGTTVSSQAGNAKQIDVPYNQNDFPLPVDARGFDRETLKALHITASSPGTLTGQSSLTVSQGKPNEVLPDEVVLDPNLDLLPRQSTDVYATAQNFGSSSSVQNSPILTVTAKQVKPDVDTIQKSGSLTGGARVYRDERVDIEGGHLSFPNLETKVVFEHNLEGGAHTVDASSIDALAFDKLEGVAIPDGLPARRGEVKVEVKVGTAGDWMTSDVWYITLLDTGGTSFGSSQLKVSEPDYTLSNQSGCTGAEGAVNAVSVTYVSKNGGRGLNYEAEFDINGGSTVEESFDVYNDSGLVGSNEKFGGVWISPNCRVALILECRSPSCDDPTGSNDIPIFRIKARFFGAARAWPASIPVDIFDNGGNDRGNALITHVNQKAGVLGASSIVKDKSPGIGQEFLIGVVSDLVIGKRQVNDEDVKQQPGVKGMNKGDVIATLSGEEVTLTIVVGGNKFVLPFDISL